MSLAERTLQQPELDEPIRSRHLRAVERPSRRRRPRLAYAIVALAGAALIGAAQIGLSIATTQDSFVVAQLSRHSKELNWQAQAAAQDLDGISSPQALATQAAKMGLVVGGSTNYLRLSDGSVIGAAGPAAWSSTVDPTKDGVANALVRDTPSNASAAKPGTGVQPKTGTAPATQAPAPPTAEGLPTPTIH
ncbi:hypothetical protein [Microbacterium panaciterrae]|uniref:Cell division protein FtsL n=1 Tax=Microbacterium panaciterrae TaxID=985759 RepID=A0ABP8PH48_9MICO